MATQMYMSQALISQISDGERTIYSSAGSPVYTYPANQPVVSDFANWFDDGAGVGSAYPHYQSIGGQWVLVGSYDSATGVYSANPNAMDIDPLPDRAGNQYSANDTFAIEGASGADEETDTDEYFSSLLLNGTATPAAVMSLVKPKCYDGTTSDDFGGVRPTTFQGPYWDATVSPAVYMQWDACATPPGYVQVGGSAPTTPVTAPAISAIAVDAAYPGSGPSGSYVTGDNLCFELTYDQAVNVSAGTSVDVELVGPATPGPLTPVSATSSGGDRPETLAYDGSKGNAAGTGWRANPQNTQSSNGYVTAPLWLQFDMGQPVTVATAALWTNWSEGADDYEVLGSNDGVNFTQIYSVTGLQSLPPTTWLITLAAHSTNAHTANINSSVAYRYLRLNVLRYSTYNSPSNRFVVDEWEIVGVAASGSGSTQTVQATYAAGNGTDTPTFCAPITAAMNATSINIGSTVTGSVVSSVDGTTAANPAVPQTDNPYSITVN